ncbi:MAG: uncharacterized protein PWR13_799 [Archaeoglobi archaeon]|nr:DUF554 domain-containing protein [Candidatus Mnemosynella bozhongmuii]MDI3502451.1 uncharacterized protein [Archaeoglobi archaeon]MDK2781771.1 uncharacterized protein [Archaeoglobi archaeon]
MLGTIINSASILIASLAGVLIGERLNEGLRGALMNVLGLPVILIGLQMALKTENVLIPTLSVALGVIFGELLGIEERLEKIGRALEVRLKRGRFTEGFVTATLLYCVGPMAILGPMQEGLTGDSSILLAKSMLDGVASIVLASALGIGVAFSALSVLLYQGSFFLLASRLSSLMSEMMIKEFTATGGLLIVAIGINLLELRKLRVGNMLPALLIAPLATFFFF